MFAGSVDRAPGAVVRQVADGGYGVADYAQVGFNGVRAGAVEDPAADYGYVEIRRYSDTSARNCSEPMGC